MAFLYRFIQENQERWQYAERANQAANHALSKHDTHVHTDAQAHEAEHQQAHYRSHCRADDRTIRTLDGEVHRLYRIGMRFFLLAVSVRKNNAIIDTEHHLQNGGNTIGSDTHRRQESIGTHIEQNGHARCAQINKRLHPRLCHKKQDGYNQKGSNNHYRNGRSSTILSCLYQLHLRMCFTNLLTERFLIHRLIHIELVKRMGAIFRCLYCRFIYIRQGRQGIAKSRFLFLRKSTTHQTDTRHGYVSFAKLSGHHLQTAAHLRVSGKVLGHVRVNMYKEHPHRRTNHQQQCKNQQ